MSGDPEALLAKYQNEFAAYENFLQRDSQTPPTSQQRRVMSSAQQQQQQQRPHVDPNETVLDMQAADGYGEEEEGNEVAVGGNVLRGSTNGQSYKEDQRDEDSAFQPHRQPRSADSPQHTPPPPPAFADTDTSNNNNNNASTSPAARPPAPRTATSSSTAAAVARAIAAHGGLDGPSFDASEPHHHHNYNSADGRRGSRGGGLPSSSAPRPLYNTHTTAATAHGSRRGSVGQLAEVDHFIEERLQSAGRYRTSAPSDAMYIKSQAWAMRRRQINEALRREQEDMELSACTFQPQLGPAAEAETASNMFAPLEDDGPYAAAGVTVAEDAGVAQHLQRQEEARRRRREAQARLNGAGHPRWTGRTTKPQEFKLGGRVAEPIPSLRKPCLPEEGEVAPWLAGAHHIAGSTHGPGKAASKPRIAFGTVLSAEKPLESGKAPAARRVGGAAMAAAVKRRPNAGSVPQMEGHQPLISAPPTQQQQQHEQEQQQREEHKVRDDNADLADAGVELGEGELSTLAVTGMERDARDSQDLVRRLSDQLAHKDAIIQEQMEDLERLHRELEAVKETLQQIASLGSVQR